MAGNMTQYIHQNDGTNRAFRNVGMLELINEPLRVQNALTKSMRQSYYSNAFTVNTPFRISFTALRITQEPQHNHSHTYAQTIRGVETTLKVPSKNTLHIQMMNTNWGSGNPTQYLPSTPSDPATAYDAHRYLKWDSSVQLTQAGYLSATCAAMTAAENSTSSISTPTITGEFSISVADSVEHTSAFSVAGNVAFYRKFFAAQARAYEQDAGWVFWSWKTAGLGDARWDYQSELFSFLPVEQDAILPRAVTVYD